MSDRASIIAFIEARARKLRAMANKSPVGWGMCRFDAQVLDALAADIRAGRDREAG